MRAANKERQPVPVIGPHFVVGDGVDCCPKWDGFVGLAWFPIERMGEKNRAIKAVAVAELKMQFTMLFGPERFDAELLEGLAQRGPKRRFARIHFAAGSVDFARAEAALFADEENLLLAHDEKKIGVDAWLPVCPVGHVAEEFLY